MSDTTQVALTQLARMRGMNRFYHERFFADVRFTTLLVIGLFVLGAWQTPVAYLLVPPVALIGAAQTAFDASYLIFSRHYASALEVELNRALDGTPLVAHRMEDSYLFPLNERKIVTAQLGRGFSWFGFMTLFYTVMGVIATAFAIALGLPTLRDAGDLWGVAYLVSFGAVTATALGVGWWWFVGGTGERRLRDSLAGLTLTPEAPRENE